MTTRGVVRVASALGELVQSLFHLFALAAILGREEAPLSVAPRRRRA